MSNGKHNCGIPRKCLREERSSGLFQRFIVVCRTIIGVIIHLVIICYDWWCNFLFFKKWKLSVIAEVLFLVRCVAVLVARMSTNLEGPILRQHRPFMSIKSFEQMHKVRVTVTRYGVPMLANPFQLACALTATRLSSFVLALRTPGTWIPCGHSGRLIPHVRLETQYIDIEKSISLIDQNFHIDLYQLYR